MDQEQLIALVRKQTGIKLSATDPVLAAAAINEVLLEDALAKLDQTIKAAASQAATAASHNEASAKQAASEVINKAADWLDVKFKTVTQEATARMLAELRQETARAEAASRTAVRAAWTAGAIGAVALSAIAGFGIAGL